MSDGLMADHMEENKTDDAVDEGQQTDETPSPSPLAFDERPEYIDEQFYDAESKTVNLEALAKSQKDFRAQARKKAGDVPEDINGYEFEADIELGDDDPLIAASKEAALKHGLSKEAYAGFMQDILGKVSEINSESIYAAKAELEKLGANHERVLSDLSSNIDKMVEIGLFSETDYEAAINASATAEGVKMMNKLFNHYQNKPAIPLNTAIPEGKLSKDELDAMVGSDEYNKNPAIRAKVKAGYEALYGKG